MGVVKDELKRMEQLGVIAQVHEPTEWCSAMVVVPKANGQVRICVDLTKAFAESDINYQLSNKSLHS